jgi:hypothetical protein
MVRIVDVQPLPDYCLRVCFSDGLEGTYPVAPHRRGGVFLQLCDQAEDGAGRSKEVVASAQEE